MTISDYNETILGFQWRFRFKKMNVAARRDKSLMRVTGKTMKNNMDVSIYKTNYSKSLR